MKRKQKQPLAKKTVKAGGRRTAKGSGLRLKTKFALSIIGAVLLFGGSTFWYNSQAPATQDKVQDFGLSVIDIIRDTEALPESVLYGLDLLADAIPLSQKTYITLTQTTPSDNLVFAGFPRSKKDLLILKNRAYVVGYNESLKNPEWVAYRLHWQADFQRAKRPQQFVTDKRTVSCVTHADYTGTGYDRGHMAPNYAIAMSGGIKAQLETFLLSNIAPQKPDHNRKIWKRLEMRVAKRIARRFSDLWVVCGPIYSSTEKKRLKSGIAIPDAFFMTLIEESSGNRVRTCSVVIPQTVSGNEALNAYLTNLATIEKLTGLTFFPKLSVQTQEALKTSETKHLW